MIFPTISVILTVFDQADCLTETLESLSNQTLQPYEVIIVNDGSRDGSQRIIDCYIEQNPDWKSYETENRGVSKARNFGLQIASGMYVIFLDGDDIFSKELILSFSEGCLSLPDVVVCRARVFDHDTYLSTPMSWSVRKTYLPHMRIFSSSNLRGTVCYTFMGWAWDKLFKRDYLLKNDFRFPELKNSEDLVFVYSALMFATSISVVDEELISHRVMRKYSLSNNLGKSPEDFAKAIMLLEKRMKTKSSVWYQEKTCFIQWALDFYLWAQRGAYGNSNAGGKSIFYINELKQLYLSELDKRQYFPFLRWRILADTCRGKSNFCSSFLYYLSCLIKFGSRRSVFILFSKVIRQIRYILGY